MPAKKIGRPKGSKNKPKAKAVKRIGRPKGSKNKPKTTPWNYGKRAKLSGVESAVSKIVAFEVRRKITAAIALLERAKP